MSTTAATFARTYEQRITALDRANDVRCKRAHLKREIAARRVTVAMVLMAPPEYVEGMRLFDLLLAVPRVGPTKVNKTCNLLLVSPRRTIGELTERQRHEIIRKLRS